MIVGKDFMMNYYRLYGLTIESPIDFPELYTMETVPENVDAFFLFSEPPSEVKRQYIEEGKYSGIKENEMWFRLYDELLIYVKDGNEVIIWEISKDIPRARLRSYILSGAITFLLFQNDYTLLHGSAIVSNKTGKAFIVSGPSGSGKSTTAISILENKDFFFASDDICAVKLVDNKPILFPGPPWQRVCEDVAERMGKDNFTFVPEEMDKYGRRLSDAYISDPIVLDSMFILDKGEYDSVNIREIGGGECLEALTHNMFRGEMQHMIGLSPQKVMTFIQLASMIHIMEVQRPAVGNTLEQITNAIISRF